MNRDTPSPPLPPRPADVRLTAALYLLIAAPFAFQAGRNVAVHLRFEDALIVLRYARNLLAGEGFVFNAGERVLGVTTPLHTLMSTFYMALAPENAPAVQNLAGLFFLLAEAFVVLLLARRTGHPYLAFAAALLVLGNFNFNYLFFGMEAHLFAFLVLLAFLLFLEDQETACGVVLGFAFLTRYDAALMAGLVGSYLLLTTRRPPWRLVAGFAAPVVPWLVFAQLYFGSILPHALAAKKGFVSIADYLLQVFWYYKAAFKVLTGLYLPIEFLMAGFSYLFLVPIAVAVIRLARRDRRWLLLGAYPFLHVFVYAAIGSAPNFYWHFYVLNPTFFLFFAVGVGEIVGLAAPLIKSFTDRRPKIVGIAGPVALTVVLLPLFVHVWRGVGRPYRLDPQTEQLYTMARWMRSHYGEETSLLQPSIGVLGYETHFRMIDHAGLVTPGLYYFHEMECTPLGEVIERFEPDLVLLGAASRGDVTVYGYQLVKVFEKPLKYSLYERAR